MRSIVFQTISKAFLIFMWMGVSSLAPADPVCVTSEKANLRKGPGVSFPVSWEVGQNMPLDRVGKKGGWVQVKDLDGETHWITSSSVSPKVNCLVVRTKMAALHQAAGARAPASDLAFADRYTPFKKVDREDAWIQVQDDHGAKFWINETNVWIPVMHSRVEF